MGDNDTETLSNVTAAEWDFDDPIFEDISQDAKVFVTDLLVKSQRSVHVLVVFIQSTPWNLILNILHRKYL